MVRRYAHMSVKHLAPYADQLTFPAPPGGWRKTASSPLRRKGSTMVTGPKNGHSEDRPQLQLVAGVDLSS